MPSIISQPVHIQASENELTSLHFNFLNNFLSQDFCKLVTGNLNIACNTYILAQLLWTDPLICRSPTRPLPGRNLWQQLENAFTQTMYKHFIAATLTEPFHWLQCGARWTVYRDKTGSHPKGLCNRRQWPTDSWQAPWTFLRPADPAQSRSPCTSIPALHSQLHQLINESIKSLAYTVHLQQILTSFT